MRKIPTILPKDTNDMGRVTHGTLMTGIEYFKIKIDGTACMIKDGQPYCRFDAKLFKRKKGKVINFTKEEVIAKLPAGAIACQEADEKSGHWPHWVPVTLGDPSQKYILEGFNNLTSENVIDGTYECIGPKLQGNPHAEDKHYWIPHFHENLNMNLTNLDNDNAFEFFEALFQDFNFEGLVAYNASNEPIGKIRCSDFGMKKDKYNSAFELVKD
jgi:hypothetical protein